MDTAYDIFREQASGPIWIETVTKDRIAERLETLRETKPASYFAYDHRKYVSSQRFPSSPSPIQSTIGGCKWMIPTTLFKQSENGQRKFVETAVGRHNLKKRLMKLSSLKPGLYLIYDTAESKFIEPFKKSP